MYTPFHDGFLLVPIYAGISYTAITFFTLKFLGYDLFKIFGMMFTIAILIGMYFAFYSLAIYAMNNLNEVNMLSKILLIPIYPIGLLYLGFYKLYNYNIPIISFIAGLILRIHDIIVYLLITPYIKEYGLDLNKHMSEVFSFN